MQNKKKTAAVDFFEIIFCALCAVAFITVQTVLCAKTDINPFISGSFTAVIYIAFVTAFSVIKKSISSSGKNTSLGETAGIMAEAIINMKDPVVITPGDGDRIIWYNKSAAELFGKKNNAFSDIFRTLDDKNGKMRLWGAGHIFMPEVYLYQGKGNKTYRVFLLNDVTELEETISSLEGKKCAVCYATVDNLEELLNFEQESYRQASGEAEKVLRKWADGVGGVLKEYQQDKYIFLFEMRHIEDFIKNGFEILDKIRMISVGDSGIPVTVSIGISAGGNNLWEREKEAQAALQTALQRGGDPAVIRTDGNAQIFGGRTKMQQKRTKVRARVVASELAVLMKKATNVLVMGHRFADFDAFGASVGIARIAKFLKVPVNIISDLDDSQLDRCREWVLKDKSYSEIFADREAAMDMIEPGTLLVIVDVNNPSQYESVSIAEKCTEKVIIDHHRKTADSGEEAAISYIEPSASAASELVAEMMEQILPPDELTGREADLMMAGILLDTNHFTKNTGTRTFSAALYLRGCGADIGEVQELFKTELEDFKREFKFNENIEIYRDITAIAIAKEDCTYKDKIPAAKAADKLLGVEGVKASFAVVPIGEEVHISARSTGQINVQLLLESLYGGGHFDSAGTRLQNTTVESAVLMLKAAIDSYLDNNIKEKQI